MRPRMMAERYGGWASEAARLGPGHRPELEEEEVLVKTSPNIFTT